MKREPKNWLSGTGIIMIAAVMVEAISVFQYQRVRKMMGEEMEVRSHVVVGSIASDIVHLMEITEVTMNENLWDIKRSLVHPDSVYQSLYHLIDDNPHILGGCLAFVPDYFPSGPGLYEPYASKDNGTISFSQIASPDHDYTQNPTYQKVLKAQTPAWSDPYVYGRDSLAMTTFSYPIWDNKGELAAVCGLDVDLSWLGDAINSRQPFASSFALLLTRDGVLVAGPSERKIPREDVQTALDLVNGKSPQKANSGMSFHKHELNKSPFWQVVEVYWTDELFARVRKMRMQQLLLIVLGLAILAFMINLYARKEKHLRDATAEKARIGGELEVARRIQQEMLPTSFPSFAYGSIEPAREVGGDLFDFFIRDGKFFFCIGDVSGKGVPSAMLMSVVHSLFRMVSRKEDSPSNILKALNEELCRGNDTNMFMTFFVGCLDLYTGVLNFGNAGHDKPFLLTEDIATLQTKANFPLGVFPNTNFEEQTITMEPGSTLLLYTDGLTEAKNVSRQQFSRNGVCEVLKACILTGANAPRELVESLSKAAHDFAGEAPQSDDLTMLAINYAPEKVMREEIVLTNNVDEVSKLSDFVKAFCAKLELGTKLSAGLRLALEESVVNVINYAYPEGEKGEVRILAESNSREVRFTITDSGVPFDPTTVLEADTTLDAKNRPIGGLGVLLTRKLMDSISYSRRNGQNVLHLTKTIS